MTYKGEPLARPYRRFVIASEAKQSPPEDVVEALL